jgi:hypothetical protein
MFLFVFCHMKLFYCKSRFLVECELPIEIESLSYIRCTASFVCDIIDASILMSYFLSQYCVSIKIFLCFLGSQNLWWSFSVISTFSFLSPQNIIYFLFCLGKTLYSRNHAIDKPLGNRKNDWMKLKIIHSTSLPKSQLKSLKKSILLRALNFECERFSNSISVL